MNWIETLDALNQLDGPVRDEVMVFIEQLVLPQRDGGEPDPVFGRSVKFDVRPNVLLFCDVDKATATIETLSLELLISQTSLA